MEPKEIDINATHISIRLMDESYTMGDDEERIEVGPGVLPFLHSQVGTERLVMGTDLPFAPPPVIKQCLRGIDAYDGIDSAAKKAIYEETALALMPGLRKK